MRTICKDISGKTEENLELFEKNLREISENLEKLLQKN